MIAQETTPQPRQRVRVHAIRSETTPDSRCRVEVELEWAAGNRIQGHGEGTSTQEGKLIAGALAVLEAIDRVTRGLMRLDYRGAKIVRAFDSLVIIVALRAEVPNRRYDLIGAVQAPGDDVVRGAVLSVLDATNRILEWYARPDAEGGAPPRHDVTSTA
jgi:hypothetical protein